MFRPALQLLQELRPRVTERELVRIGGEQDAGYLMPDDFLGCGAVISPGVGQNSDFEHFFAQRGLECLLIDGSVEGPAAPHPRFVFVQKFLAARTRGSELSLSDAVARYPKAEFGDLILQMDIEGAEWGILEKVDMETLQRFRMMAIEFHSFSELLATKRGLSVVRKVVKKLAQNFHVVHLHVNNCCRGLEFRSLVPWRKPFSVPKVIELTFLRKDRVRDLGGFARIPSPLDKKNVASRPEPPPLSIWFPSNA